LGGDRLSEKKRLIEGGKKKKNASGVISPQKNLIVVFRKNRGTEKIPRVGSTVNSTERKKKEESKRELRDTGGGRKGIAAIVLGRLAGSRET